MNRDERWSKRAFSLAGMVPELAPPFARTAPVRIPDGQHVALTPRVIAVIDHPDFQRLRRVRQLGPAHLVYPGATHTRFEHSVGVFETMRCYLQGLLLDESFASAAKEEDVLCGLAAGLLHDLGHYPFAHALESLHLRGLETPRHEEVGGRILLGLTSDRPIAGLLESQWGVDPRRVLGIVSGRPAEPARPVDRMLASMLHSPIDADKMDYLERDSIHMGVPYGRYHDRERLLSTLAIHPRTHRLAVTDKGRISAEIFIFSRYTMFSEAYWHHAVRAAEAMVERALEDFRTTSGIDNQALVRLLLGHDEDGLLRTLRDRSCADSPAGRITAHLTGGGRGLYKRLLTLSLAHRDRARRDACEKVLRFNREETHRLERAVEESLGALLGRRLEPGEVIVDVPPPGKSRTEDLDVLFDDGNTARLSELSHTVETISEDFDRVIKKVRIFAAPGPARAARDRLGRQALRARLVGIVEALPEPAGQREMF